MLERLAGTARCRMLGHALPKLPARGRGPDFVDGWERTELRRERCPRCGEPVAFVWTGLAWAALQAMDPME